jgi:para-nitrobenzyl esterase
MNALSRRARILAALLCAGLSCSSAMAADVDLTSPVSVTGGAVAGVHQGDLSVFKGIPFAAPPVRELRWRAPAPVVPWQGVRITDRYSPMCLQALRSKNSVFYLGEEPSSEDCLYLNVWSPQPRPDATTGDGVRVWRRMDDRVRFAAAVFR